MNKDEVKYIQEDEIDLRDLWKTIVKRKNFIILFTLLVTLISVVYVFIKNPIPIYSGNVMVEIGEGRSNDTNQIYFDHNSNIKSILEKRFEVEVSLPKGTNNILIITSKNKDKNIIKKDLNNTVSAIITRHKEKTKFFDDYIMTKQIGEVKINNNAINKPKKKLIVIVSFVTAFILSIFIVFFLEFISKMKEDDKNTQG
ncbi:MAG: Wzz/FepE/Etk N-terminal domain-containing protein [Poseidonibacter sp.]|uniref:Wzz/FepE/Etk N-terminal domain-containing protein n=1 Tax=Poseidonibacter sp. TaxID=2321188 RepID=UPI00359F129E